MKSNSKFTAHRAVVTMHLIFISLLATCATRSKHLRAPAAPGRSRERGDVPGWVMITMMTAIVVIALLAVFQEAVVTAVQNAFDSVAAEG